MLRNGSFLIRLLQSNGCTCCWFRGFAKQQVYTGRAIAQAVSRWFPIAAARGSIPVHSTNCSSITLTYHLGLVQ
jgi:hypothetical protein